MITTSIPTGYIVGLERTSPQRPLAHLYKGTFSDPGLPMCRHGWNRDEGTAYSIWRGNYGRLGVCAICYRRALAGKDGVNGAGEDVEDDEVDGVAGSPFESDIDKDMAVL